MKINTVPLEYTTEKVFEMSRKNFTIVGKTSLSLEKLHCHEKNFINAGKTSSTFELIFDEVFLPLVVLLLLY